MSLLSRRLEISTAHKGFIWLTSKPDFDFPSLSQSFASSATVTSSGDDETVKTHSFTVSYIVNSCGLSSESAIVASKKVKFQNPEKPDYVIAFLRAHEFSQTQISSFVTKRPDFLLADPERTFLPKLEFFRSKGLSKKNMARLLSSYPEILNRSLTNHIVPTFDFFKRFFFTDEAVISIMTTNRERLGYHLESVASNIGLFRDLGFNDSNIGSLLLNFSDVMSVEPERLAELVNKVRDMGFVPEKYTFLFALRMLSQKQFEAKWRLTYAVYERWGWSENDILSAFQYHPNCMIIAEEKIERTMEFLVNEMGFESKKIAKCPVVLFYSLEKRIIPRCSVVRVLWSKGLVEQSDLSLPAVLLCVEAQFLDKYLTRYVGKVPLLMSVYRGIVDHRDA